MVNFVWTVNWIECIHWICSKYFKHASYEYTSTILQRYVQRRSTQHLHNTSMIILQRCFLKMRANKLWQHSVRPFMAPLQQNIRWPFITLSDHASEGIKRFLKLKNFSMTDPQSDRNGCWTHDHWMHGWFHSPPRHLADKWLIKESRFGASRLQ